MAIHRMRTVQEALKEIRKGIQPAFWFTFNP